MNGPDHYRRSELLLAEVVKNIALLDGQAAPLEWAAQAQKLLAHDVQVAQVHATLALAAATAEKTVGSGKNYETWRLAIGETRDPSEPAKFGDAVKVVGCTAEEHDHEGVEGLFVGQNGARLSIVVFDSPTGFHPEDYCEATSVEVVS